MSGRPEPEDEALWRELGLDVEFHAKVIDSIHANFERQVTSRPDRPAGMAYFDGVIRGAHGARVREIMARRAAGDKFVGSVFTGANNLQLFSTDLNGGNVQAFGAPLPTGAGEVVVVVRTHQDVERQLDQRDVGQREDVPQHRP